MNNRKLKVCETAYQIKNPDIFYAYGKKSVSIPQIRLQGKWLQDTRYYIK
mgnify:CR=1 FL=1